MVFLAFHVQTSITFMRHLCCKCRKSGFVILEFPYFMCSSQTPWWNYFSSYYLTILWYLFQIYLNSHFMFAHALISIEREGQDLLELIMGRFPLKASPLLLWESFLVTCQHAQRPREDGKGRQFFWGLPFLIGKPWNQILPNPLAIIEHSSMLLSSNNLYNKFGNKSWWQWETNTRENVYREKKGEKGKIDSLSSFLPFSINNDFYPTIKFEMQKLFIYLLGQVSQDYFPLNCNCSSFMVWLRGFEPEYSMQVATSFLGSRV